MLTILCINFDSNKRIYSDRHKGSRLVLMVY